MLCPPASADDRDRPARPYERPKVSNIDLELGLSLWRHSLSGTFKEEERKSSFDEDLGIEPQSDLGFLIRFEHRVLWLPDFSLTYSTINGEGFKTLDEELIYQNTRFDQGLIVNTTLSIEIYELSLYYSLFKHQFADVKLGLSLRSLDAEIKISALHRRLSQTDDLKVPLIPMGHLELRSQPWCWISFELLASSIINDGDEWYDLEGRLRFWPLSPNLYIGLGYRWQHLIYEENSEALNADLTGASAELGLHF